MNIRQFIKRIRYRKQLKQGFGLLEDFGTKVVITNIMELKRKK